MCNTCFEKEIESFQSEKDWLKFDLELTKKLSSKKIKYVQFKGDGIRDKDDGYYIYNCLICQQLWKLKEPDYSFRGYFKMLK